VDHLSTAREALVLGATPLREAHVAVEHDAEQDPAEDQGGQGRALERLPTGLTGQRPSSPSERRRHAPAWANASRSRVFSSLLAWGRSSASGDHFDQLLLSLGRCRANPRGRPLRAMRFTSASELRWRFLDVELWLDARAGELMGLLAGNPRSS
jgi:hypothetical protein